MGRILVKYGNVWFRWMECKFINRENMVKLEEYEKWNEIGNVGELGKMFMDMGEFGRIWAKYKH